MRERWKRVRESKAYQRASAAWGWWGWIEDHVGRLVLLFIAGTLVVGVGQFVWGSLMGGWPQYAIYLTTLGTITAGLLLVMLAILVSRSQVVIKNMLETTAVAIAPTITAIPASTDWMGVPWKIKDTRARPFCPRPDTETCHS